MKYLLDASALLPLETRHGRQLIVEASRENLVTTDLAIYKACNIVKIDIFRRCHEVARVIKELTMRNVVELVDYTKFRFFLDAQIGAQRKFNVL